MSIKPIVVLPAVLNAKPAMSNATMGALALKRALVIANLGHTMSIAQCKGIYPA